ncbi:MAG: RIP metalloprotease RseP [Candidatus Magasanikbacteria bacterium]|jgi:regulator of sigma E protease
MASLLYFIIVLAILVISHEFGHFIIAKKTGMKVHEFGFGFPPRLFGIQFLKEKKLKKIAEVETIEVKDEIVAGIDGGEILQETITDTTKEIDIIENKTKWRFVLGNRDLNESDEQYGTVYSLNWLPLGGFVKIKGENGDGADDPQSFAAKKPWQKAVVLVAGVVMNIILAGVLLIAGYMIGLPQTLDNMDDVSAIKDRRIEILQTIPGKPAEAAGIKAGDVVVQVGEIVNPRLKELQNYVNEHKTEELLLRVKRGEEIIDKKITPAVYADTGKGGLGIAIAELGTVKYSFFPAIWEGIKTTGWYLKEILVAFYLLLKGLITGGGAAEAVSGPVGVAVMTGQVARLGLIYLIQFTAMLSLNLAIFNILPIPALDGGRLLFLAIAKIRRKPVSEKIEGIFHTVGFMLLMLLVVVVTVRDLSTFKELIMNFFSRLF